MIEKEINTLLTLEEYNNVCEHFATNQSPLLTQYNFYFDTKESTLKSHRVGLRIRIVNNQAEFTLKEPISANEKRETTDYFNIVSPNDYDFPIGKVSLLLQDKYGVTTNDLILIGKLVNERYDITTPHGTWEIDKSYFPTGVNYELSLEYQDNSDNFYALLNQLNIEYKPTVSKLARALFK